MGWNNIDKARDRYEDDLIEKRFGPAPVMTPGYKFEDNQKGNCKMTARSISEIAGEIRKDWHPVYFGAVPHLQAMYQLGSIKENYGADSAQSIVLYFLSNATTWRGETARRIKAELKAILKGAK